MLKKIVMFNAPPRAGKDTMAEWFADHGFYHAKFSKVLKERTHLLYGLGNLPHDHFEDQKDEVLDVFYGVSPRDAYINLSEDLMKPRHGDDIWARMMADYIRDLEAQGEEYIAISDLGFQVEWETFIKEFGYGRLSLVTIYRDGCNFNNDSREYVLPRGPFRYISQSEVIPNADSFNKYIQNNWFDVSNQGTLDDLYKECEFIRDIIVNNKEKPIRGDGAPIGSVSNVSIAR